MGNTHRHNDEIQSLQSFILKRDLRLFHFTSQRNLTGIAEHGLVPRTHPKFASIEKPRIPDASRSVHGGTCVSIGWPHFAMMANKRFKFLEPGEAFVILELDAQVLLEKNWFAFPTNSSAREISDAVRANPKQFSSSAALQVLFEECAKNTNGAWVRRSKIGIPQNLPTDPQAEIVFEDIIERHWINSVFVEQQIHLNDVQSRRPDLLSRLEFVYAPEYFKPRIDSEYWKNGVRLSYPIRAKRIQND